MRGDSSLCRLRGGAVVTLRPRELQHDVMNCMRRFQEPGSKLTQIQVRQIWGKLFARILRLRESRRKMEVGRRSTRGSAG